MEEAQLCELAQLLAFVQPRALRLSPAQVHELRVHALRWLLCGREGPGDDWRELREGMEHYCLARRVQRGDLRAFERLGSLLYQRLGAKLPGEAQREVLGEALMSLRDFLLKNEQELQFRKSPDPLSAVACRFVQRKVQRAHRREHKRRQRTVSVEGLHEDSGGQAALDYMSAAEAQRVHQEQGQHACLEERQRAGALRSVLGAMLEAHPKRALGVKALLLCQEHSYPEVAQRLSLSEVYVRQLRQRGELWLQEYLLRHSGRRELLGEAPEDRVGHALYILTRLLRKKLRGSSEDHLGTLVDGLELGRSLRQGVLSLLQEWLRLEHAFSQITVRQWRALWIWQQTLSGTTRAHVHFLFGQLPSRVGRRRAFSEAGATTWSLATLERARGVLQEVSRVMARPELLLQPGQANPRVALLRRAGLAVLLFLPRCCAQPSVGSPPLAPLRALRPGPEPVGLCQVRPRAGPAPPHQRGGPTERHTSNDKLIGLKTGPPWFAWVDPPLRRAS